MVEELTLTHFEETTAFEYSNMERLFSVVKDEIVKQKDHSSGLSATHLSNETH